MLETILQKKSWLEELKESGAPIAVYGMGNGAEKIFHALEEQGLFVECVFASDEFVRGQQFLGLPVLKFGEVATRYPSANVLLAFATDLPEVLARIREISKKFRVFCPSFTVMNEQCATREFLCAHAAEIERAYALLADDASRKVFCGVAEFFLTGKLEILDEISTPRQQNIRLLGLSGEEVYADLGAYRGDTVLEFIQAAGSYRQIFAVEPDKRNFAKLEQMVREQGLERVRLQNAAAYSKECLLPFSSPGGRSSAIGRGGEAVRALPLLSLTDGAIPTYLKMDIEGAEAAALEGMREVLKEHKPKLMVSAYHRIEDFFALPLQILEVQPDYQVYLRKSPYYPAWEVNLYCR